MRRTSGGLHGAARERCGCGGAVPAVGLSSRRAALTGPCACKEGSWTMTTVFAIHDLDFSAKSWERVRAEAEGLTEEQLAPMNVDLLTATFTARTALPRIMEYEARMKALAEFEPRNVTGLQDYIEATSFVYAMNTPATPASELEGMIAELVAFRSKALVWGTALATSGVFDPAAIESVRGGAGHKDLIIDVTMLVTTYRSSWSIVKDKCDVREADLDRAAVLLPLCADAISRRDGQLAGSSTPEGTLRVRRAWTLLDNAYTECRRALQYLRFKQGDMDEIAPNLRRNRGPATTRAGKGPAEGGQSAPNPAVAAPATEAPVGTPIGDGAEPFIAGHGNG
jgi:hypothetical protein